MTAPNSAEIVEMSAGDLPLELVVDGSGLEAAQWPALRLCLGPARQFLVDTHRPRAHGNHPMLPR